MRRGPILNPPILSVVLAVKDPPKLDLQLCLASFAALRNAPKVELVVVSSGTMPQFTPEITGQLGAYRVIEVPPEGVYAAYNAGITHASGVHVLFFGADDVALPGMDKIIDQLAGEPGRYDLLAASCYMQALGMRMPSRRRSSLIRHNWCHQGVFYLRSYLVQHPYETQYVVCADHKMNIDIVSNPRLVFGVSTELVAYFSAGGISSTRPDAIFRRDFPAIVARAYGRPHGLVVRLKQILADLVLGDHARRFRVRQR
jgi:glycosyltransferase involved in cell wall biosynthesis